MFYYNLSHVYLAQTIGRDRLASHIRPSEIPGQRVHANDPDHLSQHEGRPEDELIQNLLAAGLTHYYESEELWKKWESLSPREQEVAALVCLGYTNKQVAERLVISPETVKSHLRNALIKFDLSTRSELRMALQDWDFDAWA